MKYVKLYILIASIFVLSMSMVGCAGKVPRYEQMRTADEVIQNYDTANYKNDGMFITKKGAVVDIKFEEVKSQKKRIEAELYDAQQKIERQQDAIQWLERDNMQMRIRLGLSAEKPKASGKCCTKQGFLIPGTVKEVPTLDEELSNRGQVSKEDL